LLCFKNIKSVRRLNMSGIELRSKITWKVYFLLLFLVLIGSLGIIPYMQTIQGPMAAELGISPMVFGCMILLQGFIMGAVLGLAGMWLSKATGLGTPVLDTLLYERREKRFSVKDYLVLPLALGFAFGTALYFIDVAFLHFFPVEVASGAAVPPWWQGLLAAFYGGIIEEIMLRLFLLNGLVFIFNKLKKQDREDVRGWKIAASIVISTLVFGLGHVATTAAVMTVSPVVVFRTILLNFLPGMLFGWLYYKKGLLPSMVAHFSSDIAIHVILRFLLDNGIIG
jgi:membrane protease YdiL (CAAX protease family)